MSLRMLVCYSAIFLNPGIALSRGLPPSTPGPCALYASTDQDHHLGKPVVFGKEYTVPALHLRFVDEETGRPVTPRAIDVHYYWEWLEYPYPEHPQGAWSDAEEWVRCTTTTSQAFVPARTIRPRGWYDGKHARFPWPRMPRFDRLEIVISFDHSAPRLIIRARQLERYEHAVAVVKLPPAGRATVQFEKNSK